MVRRSWWVVLVALGGCGTETGNPEELLPLAYDARTTAPGVVDIGEGAATVVTGVWLGLGPVLLAGELGGERVERTFDGIGFADHAGPEVARQELEVDLAQPDELRTSFVSGAPTGEAPAEVDGAAVGIVGTLPDGRAFSVRVDEEVAVGLELPSAALPEEGGWLLTFDLAVWLDVDAIAALPGDPVVADAITAPDLVEDLVQRLEAGLALHHDLDGDDAIDPGEPRLDQ
jgi:hypothetical protein